MKVSFQTHTTKRTILWVRVQLGSYPKLSKSNTTQWLEMIEHAQRKVTEKMQPIAPNLSVTYGDANLTAAMDGIIWVEAQVMFNGYLPKTEAIDIMLAEKWD